MIPPLKGRCRLPTDKARAGWPMTAGMSALLTGVGRSASMAMRRPPYPEADFPLLGRYAWQPRSAPPDPQAGSGHQAPTAARLG